MRARRRTSAGRIDLWEVCSECDRRPVMAPAMLAFAGERNPGHSPSEEKSETREADRIASPSEAANPTFEDFLIYVHPYATSPARLPVNDYTFHNTLPEIVANGLIASCGSTRGTTPIVRRRRNRSDRQAARVWPRRRPRTQAAWRS